MITYSALNWSVVIGDTCSNERHQAIARDEESQQLYIHLHPAQHALASSSIINSARCRT